MDYIQKYLNEIQYTSEITMAGALATAKGTAKFGGYMAVLQLPAIFDWYLNSLRTSVKGCQNLQAKEKTACIIKAKIRLLSALIAKLNAAKSKCKGDQKCMAKVESKVAKQQQKIKTLQVQLRTVVSQSYGR